MKGNYSESRAVGTVSPVVQKTKFEQASAKFKLNATEKATLALLLAMPAFAHADGGANFSLDVSSIVSGIATLVTLVTSIGLAFLSVTLVIKAFKYIKSAM